MHDDLRLLWADNIREARRKLAVSQAALGRLCGVDQCTVSRWERGLIIPSEGNKIAVAAAVGVDARTLFPLPSGVG